MRDSDTVSRIGGDEFVVLCEAVSQVEADQVARRIVEAFRRPFLVEGHESLVTASVGTALARPGVTAVDVLRDADTAMYRTKQSGRNAAAAFTSEMRAVSLRRIEIENGLRPALERRDLELHYQPIFHASGTLSGFEALARWPLASRGMVGPTDFIPVAEATGLIDVLTEWVLEEGLAAMAAATTRP